MPEKITFKLLAAFIVALFLALPLFSAAQAAQIFADLQFKAIWNRTDLPVSDGRATRTFLWGPEPNSPGMFEDYQEAPGGKRLVQYFDKSRMEITNPAGDKTSPYFITNGLIAKELMTGQVQLGDTKFEQLEPAEIGVAGDPDDIQGPTYKTMGALTTPTLENRNKPLTVYIDRTNIKREGANVFGQYNIRSGFFVPETGHNIAGPFWDFLNQSGPVLSSSGQTGPGKLFDPVFYATGFPITEAWWSRVKVGGEVKDVLIQAFERRILTYTPSNDPAYQVEMGNVGQHYYRWRYLTNRSGQANPPPSAPGAFCLSPSSEINTVQGCVNIPQPDPNTTVSVYGRLIIGGKPIQGATMEVNWNFKTTPGSCSSIADENGIARCSYKIGTNQAGIPVTLGLKFSYLGQVYSGSTSLTPQ